MAFKKCKYCGSKDIRFTESFSTYTLNKTYGVVCEKCGNSTNYYATRDTAFKRWNEENSQEVK